MESKKGHEEPSGKTGIKTQTYQRMDLRTRGGGRVSWDEVREWHGHIYMTKCKIASGKKWTVGEQDNTFEVMDIVFILTVVVVTQVCTLF